MISSGGTSRAAAIVRRIAGDLTTCATCGSHPSVSDVWHNEYGISVKFECHGAVEMVAVDTPDPEMALRALPRRVFLRRVAREGAVSNAARRERRALVAAGRRVA